jgi:hypothetical protein
LIPAIALASSSERRVWELKGGPEMIRLIRNLVIEFVLAGALTSLVLGYGAVGLILLVVGGIMLSLVLSGHRSMAFGASKKLTTIDL